MKNPVFQVATFTCKPQSGNLAAVCLLDKMPKDEWLQGFAKEMNLSETAFLVKEKEGFRIRWFTPQVEVKLCGHATLASAHVLWEAGILRENQSARFWSINNELIVRKIGGWVEMDFPSDPPKSCKAPEVFLEVLREKSLYVGKNSMDYLVLLDSQEAVQNLKPDLKKLATLKARGLIVTATSNSDDFDFVSRFFAPAIGIDEDPVTGSAHCCLGPFWSERLNKNELMACQLSTRGGFLRVRLQGNRVFISGQAVTVLKEELKHRINERLS